MRLSYTPQFEKSLKKFAPKERDKFYKQAEFLRNDLKHPSLRAKKYDKMRDIWQARVDKSIRFYFKIESDSYVLLNIKDHPK